MANNYKNLEVWKVSMQLAESVYDTTKLFPKEELYGITSQIRRSVVSIPSNIAAGSLSELETQLLLCVKFKYMNNVDMQKLDELINRIGMMLTKLRLSLDDKR